MTREAQPPVRRAAAAAGIAVQADMGKPGRPQAGLARTGRGRPERMVVAHLKRDEGLEPGAVFRQGWGG